MPLLTICICTLDRTSDLQNCLQALSKTSGIESVEILIINNGGGEGTKAIIDGWQDRLSVRYVRKDRKGVGEALNLGWREASTEWVIYIDDDSWVYPGWTSAILDALPNLPTSCFALAGNVDMGSNPPALPAWCHLKLAETAFSNVRFGGEDRYLKFPESPLGNNMGVRRSFLEAQGGFSNDLRIYWENHLVWRGYWSGGTCYFLSEMRAAHFPASARLNQGWVLNKSYVAGFNFQHALRLLREYPECPPSYDLLYELPVALAKWAASWMLRKPQYMTVFQARARFQLGRLSWLMGGRTPDEYSFFGGSVT